MTRELNLPTLHVLIAQAYPILLPPAVSIDDYWKTFYRVLVGRTIQIPSTMLPGLQYLSRMELIPLLRPVRGNTYARDYGN